MLRCTMKRNSLILVCLAIFFLIMLHSCAAMKASQKRELGLQAYKNKKNDKALSYLLEAVKLDPKDFQALRLIGRIYWKKRNMIWLSYV